MASLVMPAAAMAALTTVAPFVAIPVLAVLVGSGVKGVLKGQVKTAQGELRKQLAEMLQVDDKTVRSLASKGELPGRKVGRHWRFSRQAVLEWLASPERRKGAAGFQQ